MQLLRKTGISLVMLSALFAFMSTSFSPVFADHTERHCANQIGNDDSPEYLECVNNIGDNSSDIRDNPIYTRLNQIINFLSAGVGVVVTISVVIAGIQYTTSRGDPQRTGAAVKRLWSAGLAIFLYVFGWAILNWLIPGGFLR